MSYSPSLLFEKRHLFYDQPRPFANNLLQICKLFDGLFLGNHHSGREPQFLTNNKITLIVNLEPQDIHSHHFKYITVMTYDFGDRRGAHAPNLAISHFLEIVAAIENCLHTKHEGVVIIAKKIESKVIAFASIYLMIKYRWTSQQAFSYINQRFPQAHLIPSYLAIIDTFSSHKEKGKLSQAFESEQTQTQKILITNTLQNSKIINMPNFHGLCFQKSDTSPTKTIGSESPTSRRVKFKKQIQIINASPSSFSQGQRIHSSISKDTEKETKLSRVQQKLRKFIKQKCKLSEDNSLINMKPIPSTEQTKDDMVFVKSKDISCRIPRKRANSKTEQSPFYNKKQQRISDNDMLIFEFKEEDSLFKKQQPLKMAFDINVKSIQPSQPHDGFLDLQSQRRDKTYILHNNNNKRYKIPKKCFTEQSVISNYHETDKPRRMHQKIQTQQQQINHSTNMFKISKSSKTSSKKMKVNTSVLKTLGKQSQKCIKINDDFFEGQEQLYIGNKVTQELRNYGHHKIINFNLNVQIQNINVIRQKTLRDAFQQKRPKMFARPHYTKKFSKIITSNPIHNE